MKFRTLKYLLKEGFSNVVANKWMSTASAGVVLTTLYIFGIFFLLGINVDNISGKLEDQPINAIFHKDTEVSKINEIAGKIKKLPEVKNVKIITKEEGFNELKKEFGNLLDGYNSDFLAYKLAISAKNPRIVDNVISSLKQMDDIEKIIYPKETVDKLLKVTRIVRALTYIIITVLGLVALFIIIYTIKLTVFSRRKEINIMKYVGATDWFIRWPFVVEGVVIGLIGAWMAYMLIGFSYGYLHDIIGSMSLDIIKFVELDGTKQEQLFAMFTVLGSGFGAIGSTISVKKYLNV